MVDFPEEIELKGKLEMRRKREIGIRKKWKKRRN